MPKLDTADRSRKKGELTMLKPTKLIGLILGGYLAWTVPVAADAVSDWNVIAVAAVSTGRPGAPGGVDLALIQAAVHDAVQAIDGRFQPYYVKISGAPGSPAAAAAAAAYGVLVGCYPAQASSLTMTYQNYLTSNNLVNDPGLAVGKLVADTILPLRRADPNPPPQPFIGGTRPGEWRPTENFIGTPPPPPAPMLAPWLGSFKPFTLKSPTQYRAPKPPVFAQRSIRSRL
jgi:hypothetical protein